MRFSQVAVIALVALCTSQASAAPASISSEQPPTRSEEQSPPELARPASNTTLSDSDDLTPINVTSPIVNLGSNTPPYAPKDLWEPYHYPPQVNGREFELIFCDGYWDSDARKCKGDCNYIRGSIETGDATLFIPASRCIAWTCGLKVRKCLIRTLQHDRLGCKAYINNPLQAVNGLCAAPTRYYDWNPESEAVQIAA